MSKQRITMKTNETRRQAEPMTRSLARVKDWELNPRQGVYRELESLKASLAAVGLQDPIHVWERVDGDVILKGHRRVAAMRELGWESCAMVVHHFDDERDAFLWLLQDHGHTQPLDAWEYCVAARNGVKLGLNVEDLAPAVGRSVERVQLWLDLEAGLPVKAKNALAEGKLSFNTAELLLSVDEAQRREAVQEVLRDQVTGEPMSHGQAKAYIDSVYLQPAKRRKKWEGMMPKLRKQYSVGAGYQVVTWENRDEYVQGDSGQPWPEYEFADAYCPRDAKRRRWMDRAQAVEVPVLLVPAPLYGDKGFVLLVSRKLLLAAEEAAEKARVSSGDLGQVQADMKDQPKASPVQIAAEGSAVDEDDEEFKRRLGAVMECITADPAKVMTTAAWEVVLPGLIDLVNRSVSLRAWLGLGCDGTIGLMDRVRQDSKQRSAIRWAFMLALCAAADDDEMVLEDTEHVLGL